MKQYLLFLLFALTATALAAQDFDSLFEEKTLRIDYHFSGNAIRQQIAVDELSQLPTWAGRRLRLTELPLEGNGQIEMRDKQTGEVIYRSSFSTLFQEWLMEEEAQNNYRSFENCYLLPFPKQEVEITVRLMDNRRQTAASLTHTVDPTDILIRQRGASHIPPHHYLLQSGSPKNRIDIAILAEGYTREEMPQFNEDARLACESLFAHEPFGTLKDQFNIVVVESPSEDSGVSIPNKGEWKSTAFGSHFSTFYSDRYLTTGRVKQIHNTLAGIPYEYIIILANTDEYGGGGIYNAFTLTTTHHPNFAPVVVHEFGHSFAGLADEYHYEDQGVLNLMYATEVEPWEQNITTLTHFTHKWEDLLLPDLPIPTNPKEKKIEDVGVYEGAGYQAKGIYRPAPDCRMRTNTADRFCPVCRCAIEKLILFHTTPQNERTN